MLHTLLKVYVLKSCVRCIDKRNKIKVDLLIFFKICLLIFCSSVIDRYLTYTPVAMFFSLETEHKHLITDV